ncbi:hypothetical protein GC093_02380 [Paenibacillus sp. LMG 31456]|uniref:Uncharacterized protein n=1 Tax=Paenibacillus foliorum TaxID=2654974 RepID=A0A972GJX3_9BACL|nr:hypothetical protein [Paenibacillus foliorum]NOU92082.1 hypothetical protein [Paenibacillus foliorum]
MKKAWHYVTAGTLMFSLTLGLVGGASAETAGQISKVQAVESVSISMNALNGEAKPVFMYRIAHPGLLQNEAHERKYLQMLVKAYTPADEAAWLAAFEGRKQVEEQFPKMSSTRAIKVTEAAKLQKLDKNIVPSLTEVGEHGMEVVAPNEGQEGKNLFSVRLNKSTNSEVGTESTGAIFPLDAVVSDGIISTQESEASPQLKLQVDFTKAVEADDSSAIKELLPKLLNDYKEKTAQMSKALEISKENQEQESRK